MKYIPLPIITSEDRAITATLIESSADKIEARHCEQSQCGWRPMRHFGLISPPTLFANGYRFRLAIPDNSPEIPDSSPFDKDGWREFTCTSEIINKEDEVKHANDKLFSSPSGLVGKSAFTANHIGYRCRTKRPLPTEKTPDIPYEEPQTGDDRVSTDPLQKDAANSVEAKPKLDLTGEITYLRHKGAILHIGICETIARALENIAKFHNGEGK